MSSLVTNDDDVEPYKSAIPWCATAIIRERPTVNYPNKNFCVKFLLFVGPQYYHDISPWTSGYVLKEKYSPQVDAKHPEIEMNSVIEVCGTVRNIKNQRYDQLQHRVVCHDIYHHNPSSKDITNPQRQVLPLSSHGDQNTMSQKQWTVDDVLLLLNKYWDTARQYYISQKFTHNARDASFIGYFDLIPCTLPKTKYFSVRDQLRCFFGVLGIVSKADADGVNLLIPTHSNNGDGVLTVLQYPKISSGHFLCLYPTVGSLCLVYVSGRGYYCSYLPLISPPWLDNDVSTHPTEFTAEMFKDSFYTTDPVTKAALLKLMDHHNKLSQNIIAKKYNKYNPPPHDECIDINAYLDIISEPQAIQKKLQQEKEQKEREEEEKIKIKQERLEQEKAQQRERLHQLQKDTMFILDVLKYHNDVIILPTAQKIIQQHPFLKDYITTQITTPFEQCQQEMYDYLDNNYSIITDYTFSSPLVSNMYYDYQRFIEDIQHKLAALVSDDLACALIQCNINDSNNNTTSDKNSNIPRMVTSTTATITTSSLLQLQSPHIYHHAHPGDWERARFPQRRHQHVLASSATQTSMQSLPSPLLSQFLSTTNTPLHHILNKCDTTLPRTSNLSPQHNITRGCDDGSNNGEQPDQYNDHYHALLSTKYDILRDLLIHTKQHGDKLLEEMKQSEHQPSQQEYCQSSRNSTTPPVGAPTEQIISFFQDQIAHLQQQLQVKDQQLTAKDQQLTAKDKQIVDVRDDFKMQLQVKDEQLTAKDKAHEQQLIAKDQQLTAQDKAHEQQLTAKDQQIQQLMQMVLSLTTSGMCAPSTQMATPPHPE